MGHDTLKEKSTKSKKKWRHREEKGDHRFEHRESISAPSTSGAHLDSYDGILQVGNCRIPYSSVQCHNPFNLRLAELNQNLNFQLFRMEGCKVTIEYECQGSNDQVAGTICDIGTDYIAAKKGNGVVSTILKERVCKIEWKDPCCNPCSCHGHQDSHGGYENHHS